MQNNRILYYTQSKKEGNISMKKILFLCLIFLYACDNENDSKSMTDKFIAQMLQPNGTQNIYGGELIYNDNSIIATNVPAVACVTAGNRLVKKGIITINDVTPVRVSSAILTELCYTNEKATLKFTPKH